MDTAATRTYPRPDWVQGVLDRFEDTYRRDDGLYIVSLDARGQPLDGHAVVDDFGDILPFLHVFGAGEKVAEQLALAQPHLQNGLFVRDGRVKLFHNHDWLLGLLDLARAGYDVGGLVREASRTLREQFMVGGFLVDESIGPKTPRADRLLRRASPFNGGFIELWVEESELFDDPAPLRAAQTLTASWIGTPTFAQHGIFEPMRSTRLPWMQGLLRQPATMLARLFKDNTNLVWGILALHQHAPEARWEDALKAWVSGFCTHFFGAGLPFGSVSTALKPYDRSLKAAFSSLDLLVDLHEAGLIDLTLARELAAAWMDLQWDNGLFPEAPGAARDHLDANVDMIVALTKLAAVDPEIAPEASGAARRCTEAILEHHAGPRGYVLAVGPDGAHVDGTIVVKYQSLLTKLALLPADPSELQDDPFVLSLLRDR